MTFRLWVVVALATVAGAAAGAHPAGLRPADIVLTGGLAGLVTFAGSRSARWTWIVIAGVAAVAPSTALPTSCAVAAVILAVASVVVDNRSPLIGAVVAGLSVQALLRMRPFAFHGAPSLVAAVAMSIVLVSAYLASPERPRRIVRRVALGLGVLVVVALALGVVAGLQARSRIQKAVSQARSGLDATQNGDQAGAMAQLDAADSNFGKVADTVGAWWAQPARLVPIAGQQLAAVKTMADEGHALAHTAATGVATIDYNQLAVHGGTIDLARLRAAEEPLRSAVDAIGHAEHSLDAIETDWLVPPLRDRYSQFENDLTTTLPVAENARDAVAIGPELLGGDGPKHYIVLLGTPSESRPLGGFVGNFAEVTADQGKLTLTRAGRHTDIDDPQNQRGYTLTPGSYLTRFTPYQVTRFFGNVGASPDFKEVANVTGQLYPQAFGDPVDGVFYMDPYSLAALLDLTGSVTLPGTGVTLNSKNAAHELLIDQYQTFDTRPARVDFLDAATRLTFEKFTSGDLPKPARVANVMTPMIEQGHVLAFSPNPDAEALYQRLGLDGSFPPATNADALSVTESNAGANKLDAYMQRSMKYAATFRPDTGEVQSTLTVTLTNSAPADGLPDIVLANIHDRPKGTNEMLLTVYTPLQVTGATTGDGTAAKVGGSDDFGLNSYTIPVDVPPGGAVTLQVAMDGFISPSPDYNLTLIRPPLVNPDDIAVSVTGTGGWKVVGADNMKVDGEVASAAADDVRSQTLTAHLAH